MLQRLILCFSLIIASSVHAKPEKPHKQADIFRQIVGTYVGTGDSPEGDCSVRVNYDKETQFLRAEAQIFGLSENEEYIWNSQMEFSVSLTEEYFRTALARGWLQIKETWPHVQSINFHFDPKSHDVTHFVLIQRRSMLPSKITRCADLQKTED